MDDVDERLARISAPLDVVQCQALALCVWPASAPVEAAEARRVASILELTLRRRRPLAAAVLSARFALDPRRADGSA